MLVVDSHVHVGLQRFEPVEALLFHMDRLGIAKAVIVHYWPASDVDYAIEAVRARPDRFAGAMVTSGDDDGTELRRQHERGMIGVRLSPQHRSRGADPVAIWRTAAELGMVVSLTGLPQRMLTKEFDEVLAAVPNLPMVIEHMGFHVDGEHYKARKTDPDLETYRQVLAFARRENLSIKLTGFGEFCGVPPISLENVAPYVDMALEAFGPRRMMWGSDFPPVSSREGYDSALRLPQQYLSKLSADEQAWVFGLTAKAIWRL